MTHNKQFYINALKAIEALLSMNVCQEKNCMEACFIAHAITGNCQTCKDIIKKHGLKAYNGIYKAYTGKSLIKGGKA